MMVETRRCLAHGVVLLLLAGMAHAGDRAAAQIPASPPTPVPPAPPPPDPTPALRADWRLIVTDPAKPGSVGALYRVARGLRDAESGLTATVTHYEPARSLFHFMTDAHPSVWKFFDPDRSDWPTRALHVVDRSTEDDYAITVHVLCEDAAASCAELRSQAESWPAPEPGTQVSSISHRQWQRLVQAEACTEGPVHQPTPPYPPAALRAGAQGAVSVLVLLNPCGEIRGAWIEKSSGNRDIDRSAVRTLKTWRMHEHSVLGRVPIAFSLPDDLPGDD